MLEDEEAQRNTSTAADVEMKDQSQEESKEPVKPKLVGQAAKNAMK